MRAELSGCRCAGVVIPDWLRWASSSASRMDVPVVEPGGGLTVLRDGYGFLDLVVPCDCGGFSTRVIQQKGVGWRVAQYRNG